MVLLLWLLLFLIPLCLGRALLCILYRKQAAEEMTGTDSLLSGWMICIGLAEAAHLVAVVFGRSFSDCADLFTIAVVALMVISILILVPFYMRNKKRVKRVKKAFGGENKVCVVVFLTFGVIVLLQFISVVTMQTVYFDGDMTLETVNSFLADNAVYASNPMTGQPYTLGIPLRLKIIGLPTLYAMLCRCFGLRAEQVVLQVIPGAVLLGNYFIYGRIARGFTEDRLKRGVFLLLVALLHMIGDYSYGMEGFGILHSGYRGLTIRLALLLPYTFCLLLRKKYRLIVLCILAEACIVWTLYGMGACVLVTAGFLCVTFVVRWLSDKLPYKDRKEKQL